jgi:hypothetical protein
MWLLVRDHHLMPCKQKSDVSQGACLQSGGRNRDRKKCLRVHVVFVTMIDHVITTALKRVFKVC